MYAFARLPRPVQWALALAMAALCMGVAAAPFLLLLIDWRWAPLLLLSPWLLAPLESVLLTPIYTLAGRFRYFSPLLLATGRRGGGLDLHVGTLFDYLACLRWRDRGPSAARLVMAELLRGLLAVCRDVETGALPPDAELTATSYFFSDRTAARLGFELRRPPDSALYNLVIDSLGVALRLSFTRGRFAFPRLGRTRRAITTAERLLRHRSEIRRLLDHLSRGEADVDPIRALSHA